MYWFTWNLKKYIQNNNGYYSCKDTDYMLRQSG